MAQSAKSVNDCKELTELLRTLLIVQLGLADVPQYNIKEIAGCSINRVNEILQLVTPKDNKKRTK